MLNRSPNVGKSKPKHHLLRNQLQILPKCSTPNKFIKKTYMIQIFPKPRITPKKIQTLPTLTHQPLLKIIIVNAQSFPKSWMKTHNISRIVWSTCSTHSRLTPLDSSWAWKNQCLSTRRTLSNQILKSTCKCTRKNIKNFWPQKNPWSKRQRSWRKRPFKSSLCQAIFAN
jgi:hypothetical protein